MDVPLHHIGWVNHAWYGVIDWKLVHDHLDMELLREVDEHAIGKGVAVVYIHVAIDLRCASKALQTGFEFDHVPDDHGRHLVVVPAGAHELISSILDALLVFCSSYATG